MTASSGTSREHLGNDRVHPLVVPVDRGSLPRVGVFLRIAGGVAQRPREVMREIDRAEVHAEETPLSVAGEKVDRDIPRREIAGQVVAHLRDELRLTFRPAPGLGLRHPSVSTRSRIHSTGMSSFATT